MGFTPTGSQCDSNTAIGYVNMQFISTGGNNNSVGSGGLNGLTTGSRNNFIGSTSGSSIVAGNNNAGIGHNSFASNPSRDASNCTFLGANTDLTTTGLTNITCVGANTTCGVSSTIQLGSNSEIVAISGSLKSGANTITATQLGYLAGVSTGIVDMSSNQTISGIKTMSGAGLTANSIPYASFAPDTRLNRTSNTYNLFGGNALLTLTTGDQNTAYGNQCGNLITTGIDNTLFGLGSGSNLTTNSSGNSAFGVAALGFLAYGGGSTYQNSAFGQLSINSVTTGHENTGLGWSSLNGLTTGSQNSFVGVGSGAAFIAGNLNSGIGYRCFYTSGLRDASNCTFLGANTDLTTTGLTNITCVGANTTCGVSSTIQLGSNSETVAISGSLQSGANTISATQLGYLAGVTNGIVDTSSNQTIGGTKTFSVAPVMSGASITASSIPYSALATDYRIPSQINTYSLSTGTYPLALTTGDVNTFYGLGAGSTTTTGGANVYFGTNTGRRNTGFSNNNTGVGAGAMGDLPGVTECNSNTAIGSICMQLITTGGFNSSVGSAGVQNLTTGGYNNFIGSSAGNSIITGNYNSGIGHNSFASNTLRDASNCTFLGANTDLTTTGLTNITCVGYGTTCGVSSTIQLGSNSEIVAITGSLKSGANTITATQLGYLAGVVNGIVDTSSNLLNKIPSSYSYVAGDGVGTPTGVGNTIYGYLGGAGVTTGTDNSFFGSRSGNNVVGAGATNTAIGAQSMGGGGSGTGVSNSNTAVGYFSLATCTTGISNTAIGRESLRNLTDGSYNVGVGSSSLYSCTTGFENTAIGKFALFSLTSGSYNVGLGSSSMYSCTIGSENMAIGQSSLLSLIDGSYNVGIGVSSLYYCTSGTLNTAIGHESTAYLTTGTFNSYVGNNAGSGLVTGTLNSGIGKFAGYNFDSSRCTFLGAYADLSVAALTNVTCVGYGTTCGVSSTIQLGSNSEIVAISGSLKSGSNTITATQLGYVAAASNGIVDFGSSQTITGVKVFSSNCAFTALINTAGQYVTRGSPTLITVATVLSGTIYPSYSVQAPSSTAFNITLPTIVAGSLGNRILFRRLTGGTTTTTISFIGNGTQPVYNTANAGGTGAQALMPSGTNVVEMMSALVSAGVYAWYEI
jgi:hypothetical protein